MFEAQAVWKTDKENEFNPAGFAVMVEVEPVSTNLMSHSMSMLYGNIQDGRCDGFIIDLGNDNKKYLIKS